LVFARAFLDHYSPIYASHCIWDDRQVPSCSSFIGWDGVS
jgi:hypothetical protein